MKCDNQHQEVAGCDFVAVVLVMSGGLLPAAVFILKDFVDSIPRSYEESARVFGASPVPVVVLYLVVNKRYGFSFQGGING